MFITKYRLIYGIKHFRRTTEPEIKRFGEHERGKLFSDTLAEHTVTFSRVDRDEAIEYALKRVREGYIEDFKTPTSLAMEVFDDQWEPYSLPNHNNHNIYGIENYITHREHKDSIKKWYIQIEWKGLGDKKYINEKMLEEAE